MPVRDVQCADAIPWMQARGRMAGVCAVTSLPDVSEVNLSLAAWREWFLNAVQLVIASVPDEFARSVVVSDADTGIQPRFFPTWAGDDSDDPARMLTGRV